MVERLSFFNIVQEYPPLTATEEYELGQRIIKLKNELKDAETSDNEEYCNQISSELREAAHGLVLAHSRLIRNRVYALNLDPMRREDAFQQVFMALLKAVESFKPEKGTFAKYAGKIIYRELGKFMSGELRPVRVTEQDNEKLRVLRELIKEYKTGEKKEDLYHFLAREMNRILNRSFSIYEITQLLDFYRATQVADSLDRKDEGNESSRSIHDLIPDPSEQVEEPLIADISLESILSIIEKSLSKEEAEIVKLHFGLESGISLGETEIAKRIGITISQVREIRERALRKLRHIFRESITNSVE